MARWAPRAGLSMVAIVIGSIVFWSFAARAQLSERVSVNQRGDFALIGNTLAQDCALSEEPLSGDVGACGANADDTGADVLWTVGEDGAAPLASTAVDPAEAASIAVLELPDGASVTHAQLYWSAQAGAGDGDVATLGRGAAELAVQADRTSAAVGDGNDYYQSSADVTAFVRELGAGPYRVSGIDVVDPVGEEDTALYAGWWLVVFYALESEPVRHLVLEDGLELVDIDEPSGTTLAGFEVPGSGVDGKLGVVAFDGDADLEGDQLRFGPASPLTGAAALDDSDNFFDGSRRAASGQPLGIAGDQPRLSGDAGSLSGIDLHVVDVAAALDPGQTSAQVVAATTSDRFFLAGVVFSVATTSPDLTRSTESVRDLDGPPLRPGDELEYTITVDNSGTGAAPSVTLSAALPERVSYVPGSLAIRSGANAGPLTDEADTDAGEIDRSSRQMLIVRVGEGATTLSGGRLAAGESSVVSFRVVLDAGASGSIVSQALIGSADAATGRALVTPTDSDLATPGVTPTTIEVDECALDLDCGPLARCDTSASRPRCVACLEDADCSGLTPTCDPSGSCVCVAGASAELLCDGKDDDCNGAIDEELAGVACEVGEGACRVAGVSICAADGSVACEPSLDATLPEACAAAADECGADADCPIAPSGAGIEAGIGIELPPAEPGSAPVGETRAGVGVPPAVALPERGTAEGERDLLDSGDGALGSERSTGASLGGGGGCSVSSRRSALEPWLALGLAFALRARSRPRGRRSPN